MSLDFIRVPLDSTGKRTGARAVTIPAGTVILDKDGTQSTLASDVTCFVQQTVASAVVSDTPSSYQADEIQPLSMTAQGRLRVSSTPSDINQVWQNTFTDDGWGVDVPSAAQSSYPSGAA